MAATDTLLRDTPLEIDLRPEGMVDWDAHERSMYERLVKPVVDRLGALALLIVFAPVMLAVAIAVKVVLGGDVLYRQTRIGHRGEPFEMLKFRTMLPDRRRRRRSFRGPDRRARHKTLEDPRHTALGLWLRRYSLDELPQLWNVLRGDLSLVGPRPELPAVVSGYEPWQHQRHISKPGLTGLWQVTERTESGTMHLHVDTDLEYVSRVSPVLDLGLLLMTVPVLMGVSVERLRPLAERR